MDQRNGPKKWTKEQILNNIIYSDQKETKIIFDVNKAVLIVKIPKYFYREKNAQK